MRKSAATFIALGVELVLAAGVARADRPRTRTDSPTTDPYGYTCGALPAADQPPCRHRINSELDELPALINKLAAWQPCGYEGPTGDGIEALTDAELDALPATESATLERFNAITVDLSGKQAFPDDKMPEALAEIRGVIAKERVCRADRKCMAVRATRKARACFGIVCLAGVIAVLGIARCRMLARPGRGKPDVPKLSGVIEHNYWTWRHLIPPSIAVLLAIVGYWTGRHNDHPEHDCSEPRNFLINAQGGAR